MRYCLLPADLAPALHDLLRRHFRDDPTIEVVVERRGSERRAGDERRVLESGPPTTERRRIRNVQGRRVGDRRGALSPVDAPELPRKARAKAARLVFVERIEPGDRQQEDLDTARLVLRIQAGERDLFATLYLRYFERVYAYLRIVLDDPHDAEDVAQQSFMKALEALPRYERRGGVPFRGWLFTVVRNQARDRLQARERLTLVEPSELGRQRESEIAPETPLGALDWVSDRDLLMFIERLPLGQRQVLLLRYMHDLPHAQIAEILDRSPTEVRKLLHRATGFLRERLVAVQGRDSRARESAPWRRRVTQVGVLRERRFALLR